MSISEATLYGDLVLYLRDTLATRLAELEGASVESARQALDDLIRAWFFTPQDELYGYTPQRLIRNEELGIRNTIPVDRLDDFFADDCDLCQFSLQEAEAATAEGHDHGWEFGLAPDHTLLDVYDPEGAEERWRIEDERMQVNLAQKRAEARALPLVGADDSTIAAEVARRQGLLEDDIPF